MDLLDSGVPKPEGGMQERILSVPLSELAPQDLVKVSPSATAAEAIRVMKERHHGSVLVMEGDRLRGIFTERDVLLRIVGKEVDPDQTPITKVMTPEPILLKEDDPIAFAIHLMAVRGVRHIPIMREEVPVGVVSIRGVLGHLTKEAL
jgi:CBS domain-containing protein